MQEHVYSIAAACAASGVRHAIICPGSRSAPLVLAFTQHKDIICYSVTDERSAGYMALGMAQQLKAPVALICTSGTAALNFYPAVAEAYYQNIPLLVLTADRPPELLRQQDGQMIAQGNVFERNCVASFETQAYHHGKEDGVATAKLIREAIDAAVTQSGPVHVNIPLREPLYDTRKVRYPALAGAAKHTSKPAAPPLIDTGEYKRIMILIGQGQVDYDLFSVLVGINHKTNIVILCDLLSNQQGISTAPYFDTIISHADEKTLHQLEPDLLISFGGPVLSKSLKLWLKTLKPQHIRIGKKGEKTDTYNNVTAFMEGKPSDALKQLITGNTASETYKKLWSGMDEIAGLRTGEFLERSAFSELHATHIIMNSLPDACNFHVANSSPVRYVSYLGTLDDSWVMSGNRGTSGIDGCTSTAVGAAIVNNRPTVLLTGDIGFLYDRNALWNDHVPPNLRIIVINNNGGGIFSLIDGPTQRPAKLKFFTTPHNRSLKNTALDNGLDYYFCDSSAGLEKELETFFEPGKRAAVLEIKTDMTSNASIFKAFKKIKLL